MRGKAKEVLCRSKLDQVYGATDNWLTSGMTVLEIGEGSKLNLRQMIVEVANPTFPETNVDFLHPGHGLPPFSQAFSCLEMVPEAVSQLGQRAEPQCHLQQSHLQ